MVRMCSHIDCSLLKQTGVIFATCKLSDEYYLNIAIYINTGVFLYSEARAFQQNKTIQL
jgi:hypothetical protein